MPHLNDIIQALNLLLNIFPLRSAAAGMAPVRGKACNYHSDGLLLIAANAIEIAEPRIGDRVNRISLFICEIAAAVALFSSIPFRLSRLRSVSRETIFLRNK